MLTRIYGIVWLLTAVAVAALYLFGNFGKVVQGAVGFFTATLVFLGVMAVLPQWMEDHFAPRY